MRCDECKFSFASPNPGMPLECRRFPPQMGFIQDKRSNATGSVAGFPGVQPHQFCGEHKPKIIIEH